MREGIGSFAGEIKAYIINGPDVLATNTLAEPNRVGVRWASIEASGKVLTYEFEPHSAIALVCLVS